MFLYFYKKHKNVLHGCDYYYYTWSLFIELIFYFE